MFKKTKMRSILEFPEKKLRPEMIISARRRVPIFLSQGGVIKRTEYSQMQNCHTLSTLM